VHIGDSDTTRAELVASAHGLAAALARAEVTPGQPVAVSLPNGAELVAALFGVWQAGACYVPINPRLTDAEISAALASVRPAAVVTSPGDEHRFASLPVVVADGSRWSVLPGKSDDAAQHDDDIALIQMTSGTTGRPKLVLLRHSGVLELLDRVIGSLRGAGKAEPAKAPMPNLIPVSLSLWAGIYQVLFALRVGAPIVVLPQFDAPSFAAAVRRFDIGSVVLPPAAMTMLADDSTVTDLSPLRYVRSITAPLSPLQARRFRDRFGIAVLNCYGQTEIGGEIIGWTAADSRAHGDDKLGAAGRPHSGISVRIVDSTGTDAGPDEAGELWVQTPALSAGYADGTDISDRLSADGWFRTGDIARIDAEGFVWIEGRISDMINRGGLKVFPEEVAEVLRLSPLVADAAVVGVPDDRLGEVPWAFIVPTLGGPAPEPTELDRLCRQQLAPYKVPVRFELIDALPRNAIGKVLAGDLAKRAASMSAESAR
jgi:acyl-CoA synthetase (AMP-forming)/AMP-acid ligase II